MDVVPVRVLVNERPVMVIVAVSSACVRIRVKVDARGARRVHKGGGGSAVREYGGAQDVEGVVPNPKHHQRFGRQ